MPITTNNISSLVDNAYLHVPIWEDNDYGHISTWDVSDVSDMNQLFMNAYDFNEDISGWNMENVENTSNMFLNAKAFNQPIGDWSMGKVTNTSSMFNGAEAFDQDIGDWNMGNNEYYNPNNGRWLTGRYYNNMFEGAISFNQYIGYWDISAATRDGIFNNSKIHNDNSGNSGSGLYAGLGSNGNHFFSKTILTDSNLTTATQSADFDWSGNYGPIEKWDVRQVTNMTNVFDGKINFNEDISEWNMGNVENTSRMFYNAEAFNQYIGDWNMGKVENTSRMFYGAEAFNQDIGDWSMGNVTFASYMFLGAKAFNQDIGGWSMGNVLWAVSMFEGAIIFNQYIGYWDIDAANRLDIFNNSKIHNDNSGNSGLYAGLGSNGNHFFSKTILTDSNLNSATRPHVVSPADFEWAATYGPIKKWDVRQVTNMTGAFLNKTSFNEDISEWNMGNVTNTSQMFQGAEAFNQDIGDWSMGNVENTSGMFRDAEAFNQDISGWNMGNVTNTSYMFNGAIAFNQDIGNWIMRNVVDITNMIYGASAFNQDINGWNLDNDKITGLIIEREQVCGFITKGYLKITDSNLIVVFLHPVRPSSCPAKVIPIIIQGNDKTRAFSYARLVNNAFGSSTHGYRSKKITVSVPENASGLPGGRRPPPRNF